MGLSHQLEDFSTHISFHWVCFLVCVHKESFCLFISCCFTVCFHSHNHLTWNYKKYQIQQYVIVNFNRSLSCLWHSSASPLVPTSSAENIITQCLNIGFWCRMCSLKMHHSLIHNETLWWSMHYYEPIIITFDTAWTIILSYWVCIGSHNVLYPVVYN